MDTDSYLYMILLLSCQSSVEHLNCTWISTNEDFRPELVIISYFLDGSIKNLLYSMSANRKKNLINLKPKCLALSNWQNQIDLVWGQSQRIPETIYIKKLEAVIF